MSDSNSPEKSPWGWKALIIAIILSCFFMAFFYLAVSNEPDYMPSQKQKSGTHSQHSRHAASSSEPTAAEMEMTEEEHASHGGKSTENAPMTEEAHQKAHDENKEHSH